MGNNKKAEKVKKEKRTKLTTKEQLYFDIMKSNNVLYLRGAPGTAKSAIPAKIAELMGYQYIPLHLAQSDNVDLGQYPVPIKKDNFTVIDFAVPGWAVKANQAPSIIHFEELNRCRQDIQDAALQLINEKAIGTNFKFNDNVLMVSSGNLGEEDGTEVKELDNAMNNRLVHKKHTLTLNEWIEGYAEENILNTIITFLKNYPEYYIKIPNEEEKAYPTPRSWDNFNKYLISIAKEKDPTLEEIQLQAIRCGENFLGNTIVKFTKYLKEQQKLNFIDILENFDKIDLNNISRPKVSEILQEAREYDVEEMSDEKIDNIIKFTKAVVDTNNEDQFASYAIFLIKKLRITKDESFDNKPNILKLARWFKENLNLMDLVNKGEEEEKNEK